MSFIFTLFFEIYYLEELIIMDTNIESIFIVGYKESTDYLIKGDNVTDFVAEEIGDGFKKTYKLSIEFNVNKNSDEDGMLDDLLFHGLEIERIVVNRNDNYSCVYKLNDNEYELDYELKALNSYKDKLHISLTIVQPLFKFPLKVNEKDVLMLDKSEANGIKYNPIYSLTSSCLIFKDKVLAYKKINTKWLDARVIVGSKRVELLKQEDGKYEIKDDDQEFLDEYFKGYDNYKTKLNEAKRKLINDIRTKTANRGLDVACIISFKYRVNPELGMFNILIEYVCGKNLGK